MNFVPHIQPNQQSGQRFHDAGILQFSAVQRSSTRNLPDQLGRDLSRLFVIAANQHVALDAGITGQRFRP